MEIWNGVCKQLGKTGGFSSSESDDDSEGWGTDSDQGDVMMD